MGMFDAERQQLGITSKPSSSSATPTQSKSIFADERAAILQATTQPDYLQLQQKYGSDLNPSFAKADQQIKNTPPPEPSKWQSITNNPIVHGAETALNYAQKPFQAISTTVADTAGAINNLFGSHTEMGYNGKPFTVNPSQPRNLISDIKNIFSQPNSDIPAAAWQGADPNSARFPGTNADTNKLFDIAFQSVGPEKFIKPITSILKAKYAGTKVGEALDTFTTKTAPQETLALPPASEQSLAAYAKRNGNVLPPNTEPIYGQGNVYKPEPLGLPQGNFTPPTRLKVAGNNQTLDYVITKIKPEVMAQIEAPARRDLLVNYLQKNLNIPVTEIHNMPMSDLQELGQHVQAGLKKQLPQIATQIAAKYGHDLPSLLEGKAPSIAEQAAKDAQSRVYGVPAPRVGIQKPTFNVTHENPAAMPETKFKLIGTQATKLNDAKIKPLQEAKSQISATVERPKFSPQSILNQTELKHANTVKTSENTVPELKQALQDQTLTGKTTSDVINRTKAAEYITQHGQEGAANKIIAKQGKLQPHEVTAAQILAKQYSSMGGEANLNKALDIISKTATEGRQMGQAIQALSQWNKLDKEGALLQATRSAGRTLTLAEGKPIIAAAERVQEVAATKSLSEEVMHIVTNKAPGEALTTAEKVKIQEFQAQVKKVNEGLKPFLPKERIVKENKADATIKEVSQIEPKARTRDQVVSFLDAKAEKARERLALSRNKLSSTPFNVYADYAIIGASHIARGVVKLSDFTEQMVKDFGKSIEPHINDIFNKANNIFRKENGLPTVQELDKAVNGAIKKGTFTEEQAGQFKAWANEIGNYADKNLKVEATQDLQKAMNEIGTSTLGQKLSTIQASAQLLSAPTALRNVIGNEAFNVVEKVNKVIAVAIDWGLSSLTGERTVVFLSGNQEKYWDNFVKGAEAGWKGVSPNGKLDAYDIHPNAFKSDANPFKYMQKATGAMLQSFDHAAYMRAYGRTLGEYSEITGKPISELDQAIHEIADQAGLYATFQDDTVLSKLAVGTKRLLNKPTDVLAEALVNKGMLSEKLSWKGFGMGDLILKYAKTPANLIMRGIDYSPIGILRGMGEILPLLRGKTFNQRAAVLALSRGITGTLGMTGLGVALISAGILTGSSSSDADIRSLDTQTGKGEYKVNWSALERYITGGLDKNAAQWQKGDRIFDWGWLQPMAISIAMGVNAQQSVAKQNAEGTKSYIGVAKDALVGSLKSILQQPLLQGVQNLVTGVGDVARYGSWTGIANIFKGAPASFVPASSGQARNFTDNTTRNTYDPNGWKQALNMVINKIPGLDKQLPIAYNTLGKANEQIQGGQANTLAQGLKSFASPVKMTNYTVSPEAKMIIDLINSSGSTTVAPRSPKKYLMIDKKKVDLTPDQYSEIQQQTGQATQQALSRLSPMLANPKVTDEIKVKEVVGVLDKVGQQVRNNLNKEYPEFRPHLKAR